MRSANLIFQGGNKPTCRIGAPVEIYNFLKECPLYQGERLLCPCPFKNKTNRPGCFSQMNRLGTSVGVVFERRLIHKSHRQVVFLLCVENTVQDYGTLHVGVFLLRRLFHKFHHKLSSKWTL